ncbi:hypothetical protein NXW50_30885 [Bacteroides thetaiotaomicron]|nr:hypothetical protein [Bacteroides thetaiotaomicron]MCS2282373.1 hypothetical protein [Bacteroides thetaiotaomicron]
MLTRSGFTDIVTGFKTNRWSAERQRGIGHPKTYFANDSVKTVQKYRPDTRGWQDSICNVGYPYQISEDKGCTLVADKPQLDADSIGHAVIGWIDERLLTAPPNSSSI